MSEWDTVLKYLLFACTNPTPSPPLLLLGGVPPTDLLFGRHMKGLLDLGMLSVAQQHLLQYCEETSENSQKVGEEKEGITDNAYFKYTNSGSKS